MSFEVKASLFKQDQTEKYNYDSGRVFRSEEFASNEACREEMFSFLRTWASRSLEKRGSEKNFKVVEEFFTKPPIILKESYLAFQHRGFTDIHLVEVQGEAVSLHEKGVPRDTPPIENYMKRIKKSLSGALFEEGIASYEIFQSAEALGKKDRMLSHFVNSNLYAVRTYSASYMGLETTYSITPRKDFGSGREDRMQNDPFNNFFPNPKGEVWD